MNEDARFRDPITTEDYLSSRHIAKPIHLLDCDYPVDSASAVIFTTGERARSWKTKPVWVDAPPALRSLH
jgi:acetyl-CoA acetyltransferase